MGENNEPLRITSETEDVTPGQNTPLPAENCAQVRPYLHRLVEDELDATRGTWVRKHLDACRQCADVRKELDLERLMVIEALVSAPNLSTRFASKVRQQIEAEAGQARIQERQRWTFGLGSAAAMILVSVVVSIGAGNRSEAPSLARLVPSETMARSETHTTPVTLASSEVIQSGRRDVNAGPLRRLPSVTTATQPVALPVGGARQLPAVENSTPATLAHHKVSRSQPKVRKIVVHGLPPGARLKGVFPIRVRTHGSRGRVLNVGHLLALANRLSHRPAQPQPARRDPCRDDPNHDGITDLNDLAYACQLVMGTGQGLAAEALEARNGAPRVGSGTAEGTPSEGATPDGTFTDSECEEYCLRV